MKINNYSFNGSGNLKKINTTSKMMLMTFMLLVSVNFNKAFAQAPSAPVATAASNLTCTSFNANWGADSVATTYYLDVSTNPNFSSFVAGYNNLNVGNVTTYNVTGLTANTTYYYRLRAADGSFTSSNSNTIIVSTTTCGQGPAAPVATAASNFTCTSFNANWGADSAATTYYLDVSTNPNFSSFVGSYNNLNIGNVTTFNVTGLTANTTYYYRLRAGNGSFISLNSNTITVNLTTTLSSSLTPPAICTGTTFSYTPTSATPGATFTWTRAVVPGISNLAGSGAGNPNETLTNTTSSSVNVTYVYTVTANGCTNSTTYSVIVTVNTCACNQSLSSSLTPPAICSGTFFSYTPTSATVGTSFAWTRAAVAGISNSASSGVGNPAETLTNTTSDSVNVTYVYTVTANGCTNPTTFSVVVTVNACVNGIQVMNYAAGMSIFPNPFTSETTLSFTKEIKNATVRIVDVLGKEVKNINFSGKQLIIEKGELNAGVYFIQVVSEKEIIANKKIVIR